jgi:hypothetical protein
MCEYCGLLGTAENNRMIDNGYPLRIIGVDAPIIKTHISKCQKKSEKRIRVYIRTFHVGTQSFGKK